MEPTLHLLLTTVGSQADASRIAREAVTQGLAACAQMSPIDSVYRWRGELVCEPEVRLLFKTDATHVEALRQWLCDTHPYELPGIVYLPEAHVNADFAAWVASGLAATGQAAKSEAG